MTSRSPARVALVTGAARGIGAATVRALAAAGWAVLATDRCADDPALPYRLGTRDELDRVVAEAGAAAGNPPAGRGPGAAARGGGQPARGGGPGAPARGGPGAPPGPARGVRPG